MRYLLKLADGESWHIIATEGTRDWVEKLAVITSLKPFDRKSGRNVFVMRGSREKTGALPELIRFANRSLSSDGWAQGRIRESDFLIHRQKGDIIFYIGEKKEHQLDYLAMWSLLQVLYSQVQERGGFPLHAALLEKNGRGVVLSAKGATGKTTCCRRVPPPWRPWCDDEVLIVRVGPQQYAAHAFPTWSEYLLWNNHRTWDVQKSIPLVGIVFLEQSPSDEIIILGKALATVSLNLFVSLQNLPLIGCMDEEKRRQFRQRIFDNVSELSRSVPAYKLRVSLTGRFWEELEKIEGVS